MSRLALILGIMSLSFSGVALAKKKGRGDMPYKKMFSELKLTEDQKAKFKEIKKTVQAEMKTAHQESKSAASAFSSAVESDKSNDELKAAHDAMIDAEANVKKIKFTQMLKLRDILTDEQKAIFKEHMSKMKQKRGKRK